MITRRHALGAGSLALLLAACETANAPARRVPEDGTIDLLTLLRSKPEHSRYLNALLVSGATARIGRDVGPVTLFAPINGGFAGLPATTLALLDNPPAQPTEAQRQAILPLVFANAAYGPLRLDTIQARRGTIATWDLARLQVTPTGDRGANLVRAGVAPVAGRAPATITRGDILASDGIIHVTSAPILP